MGISPKKFLSRPSARRLVALLALLMVLALVLGALVVNHWLNTGGMRSELERMVAAYTGMPVAIEGLRLRLVPTPRLTVADMRIGADVFLIHLPQCHARLDVNRLLRREVRVPEIHVSNARVLLPEHPGQAAAQVEAFLGDLGARIQERRVVESLGLTMDIGAVAFQGLVISMGDERLVSGDMRVESPTMPIITATTSLRLDALGPDSRIGASLWLERQADGQMAVSGNATVDVAERLSLYEQAPPVAMHATTTIAFSGERLDDLAFQITGAAAIQMDDVEVSGELSANAWWRDAQLIVNDLQWQPPGILFQADATIPLREGVAAARIHHAVIQYPALPSLMRHLRLGALQPAAAEDGAVTLSNLLAGFTPDSTPRLAEGSVNVAGMALLDGQGNALFKNIQGEAHIVEDSLSIHQLRADDWNFSGQAVLNRETRQVVMDMRGQGGLTPRRAALLWPAASDLPFSISGELTLETLRWDHDFTRNTLSFREVAGTMQHGRFSVNGEMDAGPAVLEDIDARFHYQDHRLRLEKLAAANSSLSGELLFTADQAPPVVNLAGEIDMRRLPWPVLWPQAPFKLTSGLLEVTSVSFTAPDGAVLPGDITFAGRLHNLDGALSMPGFEDTFHAMQGSLEGDADALRIAVNGVADRLGAFHWDGVYNMAQARIEGAAALDAARLAGIAIGERGPQAPLMAIAHALYHDAVFAVVAQLPSPSGDGLVELRYEGSAPLAAAAHLRSTPEGMRVGMRSLQAAFPINTALEQWNAQRRKADAVPLPARMEGIARLYYEQADAEAAATVTLDASDCLVALSPWIEKAPGIPLRMVLTGRLEETMDLTLQVDEQRFSMVVAQNVVRGENLHLQLDALRRLTAAPAELQGGVVLSFSSSPLQIVTRLEQAQVALAPDMPLTTLSGTVAYQSGIVHTEGLRLRGEGFDCDITAMREGHAWRAAVRGALLDVNQLLAANAAMARLRGLDPGDGMAMPATNGNLEVTLEELRYRQGHVRNVNATAVFQPGSITAEDISFRLGQGEVTGLVRLTPEDAVSRRPISLYADLRADTADLRFVDGLLFDHPRHFHGRASGRIEMRVPVVKEGYREMDSNINLSLADGSYGKLGFATRLTSLLRNTEVVRMRLPTLRDAGLSYDRSQVNVSMRRGVAVLDNCVAVSPSYKIIASGVVDFARNDTDVQIGVNVLERMTGVIERIPLVGRSATSVMRDATQIRLRAVGPPFDVRIQPEFIP